MKHQQTAFTGIVGFALSRADARSAAFKSEAEDILLGVFHIDYGRGDQQFVILEGDTGLREQLHVGLGAVGMMEHKGLSLGGMDAENGQQAYCH